MPREKTKSAGRKVPGLLGCTLDILMTTHGWTAGRLAGAAGVSITTISSYVWEEDKLTRERLDELAVDFMGLGEEDVRCAVLAARMALPQAPLPDSPVDPPAADLRTHRYAAALAASEVFELTLHSLLHGDRHERRAQALEQGRTAADRLRTFSRSDQLVLLRGAPEYTGWSVAFVLCADSEAAAPQRPSRALELAELALLGARHAEGVGDGFRNRLLGWCHAFVGNARLANGNLPAAEKSFEEARRLWENGEDPAGLLPEDHLLEITARRHVSATTRALS